MWSERGMRGNGTKREGGSREEYEEERRLKRSGQVMEKSAGYGKVGGYVQRDTSMIMTVFSFVAGVMGSLISLTRFLSGALWC